MLDYYVSGDYYHNELIMIFVLSTIVAIVLNTIPKKIIKYIDFIIGIVFFMFSFLFINNRAISLNEAAPYLIALAFYLFLKFLLNLFDIRLKKTKEQE